MGYPRCTHCRNPIKAQHRLIRHPLTDSCFHDDCWAATLEAVQREYARRIQEEGPEAILSPYLIRLDQGPWLPEEPEEEPVDLPESAGLQVL